MLVRTTILTLLLAASALGQEGKRPLFAPKPVKPKVVATPPPGAPPRAVPVANARPKPKPKPTGRVKAAASAPTPAPVSPAPASTPRLPAANPATAPMPAPSPAVAPAPKKRSTKPGNALASYMPAVKAAFSARWAEAIEPAMKDFTPGRLQTVFKLDSEGKVTEFVVTENSSNEAFAAFCERFVRETPLDKPPQNALVDGVAEIPFTFAIY